MSKDANVDRLTKEQIEQWRTTLCDPDDFHAHAISELNALCDLALQSLSQEAVRDEVVEDMEHGFEAWWSANGWETHSAHSKAVARTVWRAALKREPNAAGWNEKGIADIGVLPGEVDATAGPAPAAPDVASMVKRLKDRGRELFGSTLITAQDDGHLMFDAAALLAKLGQGRYSAPFKMVGGKEEWVQIRFVSRAHIHDKPTEANPSPIRVILMHELERAQPEAMAQPKPGASDD